MKTIPTAAQIRETDRHTIATTPIASIDLMEAAASAFADIFVPLYPDKNTPILICCGTGNNGGDGLAIARLLQEQSYDAIAVWVARFSEHESDDFAANLARLHNTPIPISEFFPGDKLPPIQQAVVIDALLGSGLNKPLQGDWLGMAQHIDQAHKRVVSVDVPTGFRSEGPLPETEYALHAHDVISFQRPKLNFFFPESAKVLERFHVANIGLDETFIEALPSDFKLITPEDILDIYRPRRPFSHKGTYGHALIIAGDTQTLGAALLACGASLHSGAGLTSACIPPTGLTALNTYLPEVMYCAEEEIPAAWERFDAIAIGPGLGSRTDALFDSVPLAAKPLVVDADALTFLAQNKERIDQLPAQTILTPHMKEFDRLFGPHNHWWDRVQTAKAKATTHQLIIVLKNQYTFVAVPDGRVFINPTGNPAMASGGMGDVLTGMLAAFLAQGYTSDEAAILACFLHGAAGDFLAGPKEMAIVPASRLIQAIPTVITNVHRQV